VSFRTACGPRRNPRDPFLSVLPFQKKKKKYLYTGLTQALARARCRAGDEAHALSFITTLD
jgi:hypothetical protein